MGGRSPLRAIVLAAALVAPALPLVLAPPGAPSAAAEHVAPPARPTFVNVTEAAGLGGWTHAGFLGDDVARPNFPEAQGGGACWLDYDGDGRLDVFLVNGLYVTHAWKNDERDPRSGLFRNLGDGRFADVSAATGAGVKAFLQGCAAADYDDDGDADLVALGHDALALLRNVGGAFVDATAAAGLAGLECHAELPCWGTSASWLDYDRDGCLDLHLDEFIGWNVSDPGISNGPEGGPALRNFLMRNRCDGTFEDRTVAAGLVHERPSWSSVAADVDDDGWTDLYVANDGQENDLYLNNGNGTFRRPESSANNGARNGMGANAADFNGDGRLDLITTNFVSQTNGIFRSRPDGEYDDIGALDPFTDAEPYSGWAAHFFDMHNDGRLDLAVVNGLTEHVSREVPADEPMLAYEKLPVGWRSVRTEIGAAFREHLSARGAAWADYDDDGDVDMLVVEAGENPVHLLRSDGAGGNFLTVALVGDAVSGTRDAVGARVTVTASGVGAQRQDRVAGAGLHGSSDPRLHFGLADAVAANVVVRWPDGAMQSFAGVRANSFVRVTQGSPAVEVLRALPLPAASGPGVLPRLAVGAFHVASADGAPFSTVAWDFGDGTTATGPAVEHAFRDVGTFHVRVTVTDAAGGAKTDAVAVVVWDDLSLEFAWDAPAFLPHERATGVARVSFSNGDPVPDATVWMWVAYTSGVETVDDAVYDLPRFVRSTLGYVPRWVNGTTDDAGELALEMPWSHESPTPLVPAGANQPGRYDVLGGGHARGSWIDPARSSYVVGAAPPGVRP